MSGHLIRRDSDVNSIRQGSIVLIHLAFIASSAPVWAQSTGERLQLIEQRLTRLERIVDNNDSATNMLQRIQDLQKENQELRNEIETLQFQSTQSADRERQLYIDLDQRLQALESGAGRMAPPGNLPGAAPAAGAAQPGATSSGAPVPDAANPAVNAGTTAAGATQPAAAADTDAYAAAFELLKQGRYPDAAAAFRQFLEIYPGSELRDNAQYWLAETYYVVEDFPAALAEFQKVINNYPASRKIPDAWLKVGYCNYELKNWENARQALMTAESRFPESSAAKLASERLALMSSEGH